MSSIQTFIEKMELVPEEKKYLEFHSERMSYNLNFIDKTLQNVTTSPPRILEFGPHLLTKLLDLQYGNRIKLQTIGYVYERMMSEAMMQTHVAFDFNDLQFREKWPSIGPFDFIIFCEVLEHLFTSPVLVLEFIHKILAPGGFVMCSTPNAVSFSKRIQMLMGRNPFEKIRERRDLMGHIREYTATELREYFNHAGFSMKRIEVNHYWPQNILLKSIGKIHPSLGQGFTLLAQKPL